MISCLQQSHRDIERMDHKIENALKMWIASKAQKTPQAIFFISQTDIL